MSLPALSCEVLVVGAGPAGSAAGRGAGFPRAGRRAGRVPRASATQGMRRVRQPADRRGAAPPGTCRRRLEAGRAAARGDARDPRRRCGRHPLPRRGRGAHSLGRGEDALRRNPRRPCGRERSAPDGAHGPDRRRMARRSRGARRPRGTGHAADAGGEARHPLPVADRRRWGTLPGQPGDRRRRRRDRAATARAGGPLRGRPGASRARRDARRAGLVRRPGSAGRRSA